MRTTLCQSFLGGSLIALLGCGGGGDSTAPVVVTPTTPSANTVLFDPTTSTIPLPNILATATAADPLTGTANTSDPVVRPANSPMTPPEALSYVNKREMGGTNAVSGINAPIYLRFAGPVDANTLTPANIKVFQLAADAGGTENNALGFLDVSAMFTYQYTAGGTDLFLFPNFPLTPATRYMYVVTNGVKDAATGGAISATPYFEALKSTVPLTGSLAGLEAIRANFLLDNTKPQSATNPILLSGYAKVMNDLITAKATTKISSRADISILGRFITTAAGFISTASNSPSTAPAGTLIPMESAIRAFALGSNPTGYPQGLPGKTWSHTITVPPNDPATGHVYTFVKGTALSPDLYYAAALGTGATAPASLGTIVLGTLNSADLSIDPVVAAANATTINLTGVTSGVYPAYNPAAGVVQAYRPDGLHLFGFYHTDRSVPFAYFAPAAAAPAGGYPLVIFQHGVTRQKEDVLGVVQTLTTIGYAVVAIDLPLHGQLARTALQLQPGDTTTLDPTPTNPENTVADTKRNGWGQDFMAIGAPLAARSNMQQAILNLDRLEFTVRFGGFVGLGAAMPSVSDIKFVGQSLGSIVGAYYLAGNTTLSTTGLPYTQTTLNSDMKGYLSVPGARIAYLLQNSPAFGTSIDAGLAAVHITKNSPTYHQFFQVTQSIFDPVDPASVTTPLYGKASGAPVDGPSRLSNRVCIQESVGDQVIGNAYTRYLGNALGGRAVLGAAGAAVAPLFSQLGYTAGGTPDHAAGVVSQFMKTVDATGVVDKVAAAATTGADTTPNEGYFQFDQAGISHGSLLDPTNMTNLLLLQKQMRYFLGITGTAIVVDPTHGAPYLPLAPIKHEGVQVPAKFHIFGY